MEDGGISNMVCSHILNLTGAPTGQQSPDDQNYVHSEVSATAANSSEVLVSWFLFLFW